MFRKWIDEEKDEWEKDFENNEVVTVREWMATVMLMVIPGVNIVMLFWWAFADKTITPANKVNWARASLIVLAAVLFATALTLGFLMWARYIETGETIEL